MRFTSFLNRSETAMNSFVTKPGSVTRRSLSKVLEPLDRIASGSIHLIADHGAKFESGSDLYELPRYLLVGPKGGDEPLRVGIFAGIHGDQPEGIHATVQLLTLLEEQPDLASGYRLFAYPICNPTGVEDGTRHSRNGKDLNREFWRDSSEPEVKLLQSELVTHSFHGIISLHTDDTSQGIYGFARGATLTKHLIEPALKAAAQFLPLNGKEVINGFRARSGVIRKSYEGVLGAPPKVRPKPFEITLKIPKAAPAYLKETSLVAAMRSILIRYREFIAYAPNL